MRGKKAVLVGFLLLVVLLAGSSLACTNSESDFQINQKCPEGYRWLNITQTCHIDRR